MGNLFGYQKTNNLDEIDDIISSDDYIQLNKKEIKYLVFSGGGARGISFIGALQILHKLNILDEKILGYAGTSVGSLFASILAIGYTPDEMMLIMNKMDFNKIADSSKELNYIYDLLGDLISVKTGNPDYSIKNLYLDKNIKLIIPVTSVLNSKLIYFNQNYDIPIRMAVKMSMTIPHVFNPVIYEGGMYVDGGVFDYYPISVFDDDIQDTSEVLGFKICSKDQVLSDINNINLDLKYIDLFFISNEKRELSEYNEMRTVKIWTDNIDLDNFNLDDHKKIELILTGSECTSKFFEININYGVGCEFTDDVDCPIINNDESRVGLDVGLEDELNYEY